MFPYPWRCLWRGFAQTTRTRSPRLTVLHFTQIFFTDARTFIQKYSLSVGISYKKHTRAH